MITYKLKRVQLFTIRELKNLVEQINSLNISGLIEISDNNSKVNLKSMIGVLLINASDNLVLHIETDNIKEQEDIVRIIKNYFIVE